MSKHLKVLDNVSIAAPCDASWGQMVGDNRVRHCGHCEKNVYNLTEMSEDEIFELIAETDGNFCGRLYQRADGTMLLEDCPVGVAARAKAAMKRVSKLGAMAFAGLFGIVGGLGLLPSRKQTRSVGFTSPDIEEPSHVQGKVSPVTHPQPPVVQPDPLPPEPFIMGEIAIEPPPEPEPMMGGLAAPDHVIEEAKRRSK